MSGIRGAGASIAGGALVAAGKVVALVQTTVCLQRRGRPLTADELALLRNVYRNSIAYDRIRIVEGRAGVFSINERPFTLGDTIYLKHVDPATDPSTLVHECCHVWQYQHAGSRYAVEALWAQARVRPSAYRWADELDRGRVTWRDFNREAQAQLLQDVYRTVARFYDDDGDGDGDDGARFRHHGTDYTDVAREAIAYVRGLPPRR